MATEVSSAFSRVSMLLDFGPGGCDTGGNFPIENLRKYECAPKGNGDYRHRMLVNFLATTVAIVLMVTGMVGG